MTHNPYIQIDWGIDGVEFSLKNRDILVIVDTLRFSSAVVTAIANGFTIYPVSDRVVASRFAASISADFSGKQGETKYTLSPLSFLKASKTDNKIIVLSSPNGAACAELIKEDDIAYVGCLLNAHAIGEQVTKIARKKKTECDSDRGWRTKGHRHW